MVNLSTNFDKCARLFSMDKISSALRRLDLSESEQTIYLSLLRQGRATPRILADRTGLTRPSVYDQLRALVALNLVVELEVEGKAHFAAADIKHLDGLLLDKIDRLEQSRAFLAEALPDIQTSLDTVVPKIRFFEGTEGIKQLMKDIMWHDHTTLYVVWAVEAMAEVFDATFLGWWNERRQARHIRAVAHLYSTKKKKKIAPSEAETVASTTPFTAVSDTCEAVTSLYPVNMAMLLYDTKVAFISSTNEAFGFIVESGEFATLQKALFLKDSV